MPLEMVVYRPIMAWARLKGTWRFLRGDRAWHKFERNVKAGRRMSEGGGREERSGARRSGRCIAGSRRSAGSAAYGASARRRSGRGRTSLGSP